MPRVRHSRFRAMASSLAALSALACSGPAKTVARDQPCETGDKCEAGLLCFEGLCRQVCNSHQDCAKTEACQPGVCVPVADRECDEDADCDQPSACETGAGATCLAGECHYEPRAPGSACEDGDPCTHNDQCSTAGDCIGEALVCNEPPPDVCVSNGTVFRDYPTSGACNPELGSCEYVPDERDCPDCEHECLNLPRAPGNVQASAGDAQVTLTWEGITSAQSYAVYVSQTAGGAASAVPVSVESSPYVRAGLTNGTTYYFAVSAVAEAGEGDLSDEVSATPRISAPAQAIAVGNDQKVTLSWEPVSGADSYNLYWADQPGVTTLGSNRVGAVTSPYEHTQLVNNTRYYYALTAVDGPSESELSAEVSASTLVNAATKLMAPDAQAYDTFGDSAAISGDYAIVGATYENGGAGDLLSSAGAAYVFHFDGSGWDSGAKLVAPDAQAGDCFGGSVAISGGNAIVGAANKDGGVGDPLDGAGAAYVLHFDGSGWNSGTKLVAPDAEAGDRFGWSVALSGDFAIVGAPYENWEVEPWEGAGAAYVFHLDGSGWDSGTKLVAPDAQAADWFGRYVAVSGDYAIVGAPNEDGGNGDPLDGAGAAYVFHYDGSAWDSGTKLVALDAQAGDEFGRPVALSGDYAIVGAHNENGGEGDPLGSAGAAYVFRRTGPNTWDAGTKLVAPDAQAGDEFGRSVGLSGDRAIVGAWQEDGGDVDPHADAGAAYIFVRTGPNTWDTGTKMAAPDAQPGDEFGRPVAISNGRAIVGAANESGGDGDPLDGAGAAYVFEY